MIHEFLSIFRVPEPGPEPEPELVAEHEYGSEPQKYAELSYCFIWFRSSDRLVKRFCWTDPSEPPIRENSENISNFSTPLNVLI